jgi:hypothetical protein
MPLRIQLIEETEPRLLGDHTSVYASGVNDEELPGSELDEQLLHELKRGLDLDGNGRLRRSAAAPVPAHLHVIDEA